MKERLQKFLAACGVASRRASEELIKNGRVKVNGVVISGEVTLVDPDMDIVEVDGARVAAPEGYVYYAVNKPIGYTSTADDPHADKKVTDIVPKSPRVFPIGRLDKNSEGLIILTNDGELTNKLTHPKYEHEKEYEVSVKITEKRLGIRNIIKKIAEGVNSDGDFLKADLIEVLKSSGENALLKMVLKQGKKRHIRRMCEEAGLVVERLLRVRVGKLKLGNLKSGQYIKIEKKQII